MGGRVGHQPQPFGLQSVGPQGAHHIAQPLRPVAQSEPPPVPRSHTRQPGFTEANAPRARASPPRGKTPSGHDRV